MRRGMLAVCAAGRILNPKSARSQVIGAMTMGVGAALMEELAVDKRLGFFVNHDLAGYEVPVHADIPHQEVIFLEETDPIQRPGAPEDRRGSIALTEPRAASRQIDAWNAAGALLLTCSVSGPPSPPGRSDSYQIDTFDVNNGTGNHLDRGR